MYRHLLYNRGILSGGAVEKSERSWCEVGKTTTRDQAINIRTSRRQRDLIDRAAAVLGQSRSEFMLETASREAEKVLLDQTFFRLDADAFAQFSALLDSPPVPSSALRELMHHKTPWE